MLETPLPPDQLLPTLLGKLALMAMLATMLARYRRFRHILIFERRGWLDRLVFTLALGIPLTAGVAFRAFAKEGYRFADLTLEGSFLAGLIAGPYTGALVGAMVALPAIFNALGGHHELIALPFAVGCGFAGGGLREICPKEAIWHFSPLFFTDLHRNVDAHGTLNLDRDRFTAEAAKTRFLHFNLVLTRHEVQKLIVA